MYIQIVALVDTMVQAVVLIQIGLVMGSVAQTVKFYPMRRQELIFRFHRTQR